LLGSPIDTGKAYRVVSGISTDTGYIVDAACSIFRTFCRLMEVFLQHTRVMYYRFICSQCCQRWNHPHCRCFQSQRKKLRFDSLQHH